jgi:hypothetical protein
MIEKLTRTYRADKTPDGQWTVFRVIISQTGPWYWKTYTSTEERLGTGVDENAICGLINRDIIHLSPERVMETNNYDSSGRSTDLNWC